MSATAEIAPSLLGAVDHFAARAALRLFAEESPDGDLGLVPQLLEEASQVGILGDPDPERGHWGVWGQHADEEGASLSLETLRRVGHACAGLAAAIHAQGLGCRLLGTGSAEGSSVPAADSVRPAAGFSPRVGLPTDTRAVDELPQLEGARLNGTLRHALSAGTPDLLVLAVRERGTTGTEPLVVALRADAAGAAVHESGRRIGLRAMTMSDVELTDVEIGAAERRFAGAEALRRVRTTMACDWLGQAAIALGTAEGALAQARTYTESRIQGGAPISQHAAIRMLLARGEHGVAILSDVLGRYAETPLSSMDDHEVLRWAIDARLAAAELAGEAVTNALQTHGGYGYMDEYGLSKRLRDLTALRVLHGGPDQLLLARHELEGER